MVLTFADTLTWRFQSKVASLESNDEGIQLSAVRNSPELINLSAATAPRILSALCKSLSYFRFAHSCKTLNIFIESGCYNPFIQPSISHICFFSVSRQGRVIWGRWRAYSSNQVGSEIYNHSGSLKLTCQTWLVRLLTSASMISILGVQVFKRLLLQFCQYLFHPVKEDDKSYLIPNSRLSHPRSEGGPWGNPESWQILQ